MILFCRLLLLLLLLFFVFVFKVIFFKIILLGIPFECQTDWIQIIWLVVFVALRPKLTAIVIAGRSVHLTRLFPGQA